MQWILGLRDQARVCALGAQAPASGEGRLSAKNGALGRAPALAIHAASRGITALAVAPDGMRVATAGRDGVLRVHDLATGALITGFMAWRFAC